VSGIVLAFLRPAQKQGKWAMLATSLAWSDASDF
jgi:hypothetical protein